MIAQSLDRTGEHLDDLSKVPDVDIDESDSGDGDGDADVDAAEPDDAS